MEIKFDLNDSLFLKDPQDTPLGRKIVEYGIILIDNIGFEGFTFKKLAKEIASTEKSIYRYFENKHHFLLFLTSWYWEWVRFLIQINIKNVECPRKQLRIAIKYLVLATAENPMNKYINENLLHKLVIKEGGKAYHINEVDDENKAGMFLSYKFLVKLVSDIVSAIDPKFPYSDSLASNLFEMANNQIYFAEHIPKLTSLKPGKNIDQDLIAMLIYFAEGILNKQKIEES